MTDIEPKTREEHLLNAISDGDPSNIEPKTRREHYLSAIAGETDLPAKMQEEGPRTREEIYYQKILDNGGAGGGGGEAEGTVEINITQNGTITRNVARYASAEITTNVPNSYEASDEGKVVSNGALASQTSRNVSANGTYDTTVNDEVVVNVPNPSTGTKQITSNGTHDVTDYASASVNVPNSYASSDEGKVVSNGGLIAQTSRNVAANGTYDTTLNDEVVVNVPTGITPTGSQTFTENGTYDVTSLAQAVVNVASSGGGLTVESWDYVQAEDWLSAGAGGNTQNFWNVYVKPHIPDPYDRSVLLAFVSNNGTTGNRIRCAYGFPTSGAGTSMLNIAYRGNYSSTPVLSGYDGYMYAGANIKVVKITAVPEWSD